MTRKTNGTTKGRLFVLDLNDGRIFSTNSDGTDKKILVTDCRLPDGVVVDAQAGHLYWTNMGVPSRYDGSIERCDLDGRNRRTIIPQGATFMPKQLHLDQTGGTLYWCDREGMRPLRYRMQRKTLTHAGRDSCKKGCEMGFSHQRNTGADRRRRGRPPRSDEVVCRNCRRSPARQILLDAEGP